MRQVSKISSMLLSNLIIACGDIKLIGVYLRLYLIQITSFEFSNEYLKILGYGDFVEELKNDASSKDFLNSIEEFKKID